MFVRVDDGDDKEIEGFSYENRFGDIEVVHCGSGQPNAVDIVDSLGDSVSVSVYYEDIPKLIKALRTAYKHKMGVDID